MKNLGASQYSCNQRPRFNSDSLKKDSTTNVPVTDSNSTDESNEHVSGNNSVIGNPHNNISDSSMVSDVSSEDIGTDRADQLEKIISDIDHSNIDIVENYCLVLSCENKLVDSIPCVLSDGKFYVFLNDLDSKLF
jgi:hypothetical protein